MASSTPSQQPPEISQPQFTDDKPPHCIPFILTQLSHHQSQNPSTPFIIGLNGVQGAGKTTLVSALRTTLQNAGLETLVLSIDDLYLTHADQVALARQHEDNKLVQYRGEPGTHDMALARSLFTALQNGHPTLIPAYDKSAFSGAGDRLPPSSWRSVNQPSQAPIRVIIIEGWCVGFRALSPSAVASKHASASADPTSTLPKHKLEHLLFVNEWLAEYDVLTDAFDAFVHVDARETGWVYEWREEQEGELRRVRGVEGAMSEEGVRRFVDGYFPAYELYTEGVRGGVITGKEGAQLRLVVGRDRRVVDVVTI